MGLETATYVSDLTASNPVFNDQIKFGDDHIRMLKSVLQATFPNASKAFRFPAILSKTANYTLLSSDQSTTTLCNTSGGAFTVTLPSLAAGDAGWTAVIVKTTTDTNHVTVSPPATINGETSLKLTNPWDTLTVQWTGTTYVAALDPCGLTYRAITGNYTVVESDLDGIIYSVPGGANATITLPAVANYRGRSLIVVHNTASFTSILDGNGSETINGSTTLTLSGTYSAVQLIAGDTQWLALTISLASTTEVLTGTDAAKSVTPDALASLWEQGSDVASAGTISLGEGGYFNITGTTTITDIDFATDKAGRKAWVKFAGALTLTHNATTLILPGGANITTAAGDTACFVSEGSDAVRCVSYNRASGQAVVATGGMTLLGTITTTSGASQSLSSLTLTGYKMLKLWLKGVSISTAPAHILIGNSTADDVQFVPANNVSASEVYNMVVDIDLADGWSMAVGRAISSSAQGAFSNTSPADIGYMADTPLSNASTTISVAPNTGNFDAGSITVWGIA